MASRELAAIVAPNRRVPAVPGIAILGLALVLIALYALTQGAADIPFEVVVRMLVDRLPFVDIATGVQAASWEQIVFDIRLPRVLAAGFVGAALAVSGSAYQGCFRNPLADPYLLGVAAGAGLAVALAYVSPLPVSSTGFVALPLFAFVGGMGTVLIVYMTARTAASLDNGSLILAGVIGFLGLIVPHLARLLFGTDYRRTLPVTILGGAALLIAVDLVARTIIQPQEIPVGVLTAILGGPFFILLLRGRRVFL